MSEPTKGPELIFLKQWIGGDIREIRVRAGMSLRELEKASGVTDSEIYKIEAGLQDSRLDSFVRICAALGVKVGQMIDDAVLPNMNHYMEPIERAGTAKDFCKSLGVSDGGVEALVASLLGSYAAFIHHLLIASDPVRLSLDASYPSTDFAVRCQSFATRATAMEPLDKISMLRALRSNPGLELSNQKLLDPKLFKDYVEASIQEYQAHLKATKKGSDLGKLGVLVSTGVARWFPSRVIDRDTFRIFPEEK